MTEQYTPTHEISTDQLIEQLELPRPSVIALEGGPCGGKTTIANLLAKEASSQGRPVVILPEAATELGTKLLERGLSIPYLAEHDRPGYLAFQKDLLTQIATNIEQAKLQYAGTNALIIADRADTAAYMSAEEYDEVLTDTGLLVPPHCTLVDTIMYLPSLAHQDAERYELLMQTNNTRYESSDDAIATCMRNLRTISIHPDVRVYCGTDFAAKTEHVLGDIMCQTEREKPELIASGDSYATLQATLVSMMSEPLQAMAITRTAHDGFDLEEHRKTESNQHLYYFLPHNPKAPERSAISNRQFDALYDKSGCIAKQSYIYRKHVISNGGNKVIVATKHYYDGHWTLEI